MSAFHSHITVEKTSSLPLHLVTKKQLKLWLEKQNTIAKNWLSSANFKAEPGSWCPIPDESGALGGAVAGISELDDYWAIAHLPAALPTQTYHLEGKLSPAQQTRMALGWALGSYHFSRYKKTPRSFSTLVMPAKADKAFVLAAAESIYWARDMINTPAVDMLPSALEAEASKLKQHKAKWRVVEGEALLSEHYPLIHTVGKASTDAPRLIDLRWGKAGAPKVTLVGKGVCFDSGGLDIKSTSNMKLMKKDMGGAASVLALAKMIMSTQLPVQLRVLVPAVENAISGNAMRPLDVVKSRKGLTVEIGNTDAEGRLILCDALADADAEKPEIIIDCATLTGAARVALGTELPAFFTPDDALAADLAKHSLEQQDPMYRLPLWGNYRDMINSQVADISNEADSGYAGAITAALFLREFVEHTHSWVHIDMMAWNTTNRPGRPQGGEAMGVRALYALLKERYE